MNKNVKYIIENIVNFNSVDYSDEDPDLIDRETVTNLTYKYHPKTKEELQEIIIEKLKKNIEEPCLNDIDTSKIIDMSDLFSSYRDNYLYQNDIDTNEIIKLDLSDWDVSNVTNMSWMFNGCSSLEKLDISQWDTSNVTNMIYMFQSCSSLKELDISDWDTSKVKDMNSMFQSCDSLKGLDLSNWNTSNVENIGYMFYGCSSLKKLNISGWDMSNVVNKFWTFQGCNKSIIPPGFY